MISLSTDSPPFSPVRRDGGDLRAVELPLCAMRHALCCFQRRIRIGRGTGIFPASKKTMNGPPRWRLGFALLALFLLILPSGGFSQTPLLKYDYSKDPIRIRADSITYDDVNKVYLAEGHVEISQGDRKLTASRVALNSETQEAEATGNVVLVQGEDSLRGDRMNIALDTNLGVIVHGVLFLKKQNYYLRGEEIERLGEETYRVREGSFTTCNGDWPAWRFTAREALIVLEEYADVWGATFQVKNVPLLYSPYLALPIKTQRQSGFLFPRVGYSNTSGAGLGLAYYWAIAGNMDATFDLDLYTERGIGEGLEYRYVRKEDSAGSLNAYHIREWSQYRERYTQLLDRGPDRWNVEFAHDEYFTPDFFGKTRLRAFSDRQYFKDYASTYADQSSVEAYSILSLTRNWERYSLFGEARHTVDLVEEQKNTLQYYPITHLVGIQQRLAGTPLFFNFDSSYGYFSREQGPTGNRIDVSPQLSLPLRWGGLEFNTALGGRETWYAGIENAPETSLSRELWNFQTSLATDVFRVFETGSASVPKLQHVIRPEIGYAYIPEVGQSRIPYYDLPVPKTNALFYGFSSRLIAKLVEGSTARYHEYAYLRVGHQYNLTETTRLLGTVSETRRGFGVLSAELKVHSLKYLNVENITNYDPNTNKFETSYTTLSLSDSRGDSVSVEHTWIRGVQEQVNAFIWVRLLSFLDFSAGTRYSIRDEQTLESNFGLHYRQQCWSLDTSYWIKPSVAGAPAEKKVLFLLTLLGVTSVGSR